MIDFIKVILIISVSIWFDVNAQNEVAKDNEPVVQITASNFEKVLQSNKNVFIAFGATWCPYSSALIPIWKSTAQIVDDATITFAKVNCVEEPEVCEKEKIGKFPTMLLYQNGIKSTEYRGQRNAQSFKSWLKVTATDPIEQIKELKAIEGVGNDISQPHVILAKISKSFPNREKFVSAFTEFAVKTRAHCNFYFMEHEEDGHEQLLHKHNGMFTDFDFNQLTSMDSIENWMIEYCDPLVKKLTYTNSEELVEQGKPFLVLFSKFSDDRSETWFTNLVNDKVKHERSRITFLTADAENYQHPIAHLGRSLDDCPIVAIDSFSHMYVFDDDVKELEVGDTFQRFIDGLFNSQHHEHFHRGDPNAHHCFWRQTGSCSSSGNRESHHDAACDKIIAPLASGFCECGHGIILPYDCDKSRKPFTCAEACKDELDKRPVNLEKCMFRQTKACENKPDEFDSHNDADCYTNLQGNRPGVCECGLDITVPLDCGHSITTCALECTSLLKEKQKENVVKSVPQVKKKLAEEKQNLMNDNVDPKKKRKSQQILHNLMDDDKEQNNNLKKPKLDSKSAPFDSTFKDLGPSKNRYSLFSRDEL